MMVYLCWENDSVFAVCGSSYRARVAIMDKMSVLQQRAVPFESVKTGDRWTVYSPAQLPSHIRLEHKEVLE